MYHTPGVPYKMSTLTATYVLLFKMGKITSHFSAACSALIPSAYPCPTLSLSLSLTTDPSLSVHTLNQNMIIHRKEDCCWLFLAERQLAEFLNRINLDFMKV